MKHIVWKPYWNYLREEQWLNEMPAKGLAMYDYTWCRYVFEDAPKGEYLYRIELLEHRATLPESRNYIAFLEEAGVEFVASYLNWAYFRKKAADGPFELYTDFDSKLKHFRRVAALWTGFTILEFFAGIMNILIGVLEPSGSTTNLVLGIGVTSLGFMFVMLTWQVRMKIRQLKKEKRIRES
jgi:hypothetical protein